MLVAVVGQGYVGLTASVGLAAAGHDVIGVERDLVRLERLRSGSSPVFEPGLQDRLTRVLGGGHLTFAAASAEIPSPADAVIVTVDSPSLPSGAADVGPPSRALVHALDLVAEEGMVIVKSTVPPGSSERWLRSFANRRFRDRYVYNPEFLSQGTALDDWDHPSRLVFGLWNDGLLPHLGELYRDVEAPWVVTKPVDAEMIKYASNAGLATKISFTNEIANVCEKVGADVERVVAGMSLDPRLGASFWRPGIGYGDSCLPKDLAALIHRSSTLGSPTPLLRAVQAVNDVQRLKPLHMVQQHLEAEGGMRGAVAVLGLSYEPHSDDMRAAPSIVLVPELAELATEVRVWDPVLPRSVTDQLFPAATRCDTILQAVDQAGVVVVLTEFEELRHVDWRTIAPLVTDSALVVDAKNCLDPRNVVEAGLRYRGVGGRGPQGLHGAGYHGPF